MLLDPKASFARSSDAKHWAEIVSGDLFKKAATAAFSSYSAKLTCADMASRIVGAREFIDELMLVSEPASQPKEPSLPRLSYGKTQPNPTGESPVKS